MVKILIMTIQVNTAICLVLAQISPELSLLKFLPLTYHHSHFLATTLDFTSFFTIANSDNSGELAAPNSPELSLLKFLPY